MRNLKKFLALVLALMMAMSLMVTANAATTNVEFPDDYAADPAFEEAIDVLAGMGVFKGDDKGNFNPANSITRAETAAIIYRLITADVDDSKADLYRNIDHPFTDVTSDKWYAGYVGYLWSSGIIKGTNTAGTLFDPAGQVTGYQALAMILRAVGYDKNHEFEGGQWIYNISMIANNKGILTDVNKTNYGAAMLHNAARRDVVASLLFRTAAYVPQVVYTSAFQYQEYGMTSNTTSGSSLIGGQKNPTLGKTWFGLTENYGIVLGNEATGEGKDVTKIGFELDLSDGSITDNISSVSIRNNTVVPNYAYRYDYDDTIVNDRRLHRTDSFKWDTGLDLFGHGVKVWYDSRDGANKDTYAMYDQAKTNIVRADDADISDNTKELHKAATTTTASLSNNWNAPGLKVHSNLNWDSNSDNTVNVAGNATYFNYAFSRMASGNYGADSVNWWKSPIKTNEAKTAVNASASSDWPLYLLISNDGGYLDMVVALDMTFTRIVQENNTTGRTSVGVLNGNGAGYGSVGNLSANGYFGVGGDVATGIYGTDTSSYTNTDTYVNLAKANLVKTDKTARGTKVAAIEITGTTNTANGYDTGKTNNVDANDGNASAKSPLVSTYYYQLTEPTHVVPGTVVKIDTSNQDVYLSDGSVLKKSVLSEAVDGTFRTNRFVNAPTVYKTYTFTLDNEGRYIYWEESTEKSNFVYGTYIDYTTELASSTFVYPLVYVDANGQAKQQANVNKINGYTINVSVYGGTKLNKRDTATLGNTSGYAHGMYVGYALSESGTLMEVTSTDDQSTGFLRGGASDFGANAIEIDSNSLAIGAEGFGTSPIGVANEGYFLTENTKFYVVNGAGMDNQTVKTYNGIKELMAGMSKVTIDATKGATPKTLYGGGTTHKNGTYLKDTYDVVSGTLGAAGWEANVSAGTYGPYDLIYYNAGDFAYSQSYQASAKEIKTVYIPADLIKFTPATDNGLYFVGDSQGTIINAYGAPATLFTMYRNGVEENVWVKGLNDTANTGANSADKIIDYGDNVFYTLLATSDKAQDGNTIYEIDYVNDAQNRVVGRFYTDDADRDGTKNDEGVVYTYMYGTNPGVAFTDTDSASHARNVLYSPTTYSTQVGYISDTAHRAGTFNQLYNVGSAVVKNTDQNRHYTINNLDDLNNAGALQDNNGVGVSMVLESNLTASYIYVNNDRSST